MFCPPKIEYLANIKMALVIIQLAFGLQINFHKSSLIGLNVPDSWIQNAASSLLCKISSLPFNYLGLSIGGNCASLKLWDPIISKMEKSLLLGRVPLYLLEEG